MDEWDDGAARSIIRLAPVDVGGVDAGAVDTRPMAWRFVVEDGLCAGPRGRPFLFGGTALGAAVAAMERSIGRPVIWACAQYHSFAMPGMALDLSTRIGGAGRRLTQAQLVGAVDGRAVITVQATLGEGDTDHDGQWTDAPPVPSWRDCPVVEDRRVYETGINTRFEFRLARGRYPDGRSLDGQDGKRRRGAGRVHLWVRPVGGHPIDRPMLAIIADYVSVAICDATGEEIGANSLDNTVRFCGTAPGDWVLADIGIDGIAQGMAHGGIRLFAESGALLATASTSLVLRGG